MSDATSGYSRWSHRVPLPRDRSQDALDPIVAELVGVLDAQIDYAEQVRARGNRQNRLEFNNLIWRGRWHLNRLTRTDSEIARRLFEQALELEPDSPEAIIQATFQIGWSLWAKVRKLALTGAVRIRYLIDRAISDAHDRARRHQEKDAVIDRLVAHQKKGGEHLCTDEIRSIVIGIMTGMVPTSTLGAGKMMEELQRRDLLRRAIAHARIAEECRVTNVDKARSNRKILRDILFEALRLNPALSPGLFRHVPRACSIAGTHVPAGSIVLAGAMSALRDSRWFKSPGEFIAERSWAPLPGVQPPLPPGAPTPQDEPATLMFGAGAHGCLAAHLAMEQITEMFQILLSQEDRLTETDSPSPSALIRPSSTYLARSFCPTTRGSTLSDANAKLEPRAITGSQRNRETRSIRSSLRPSAR